MENEFVSSGSVSPQVNPYGLVSTPNPRVNSQLDATDTDGDLKVSNVYRVLVNPIFSAEGNESKKHRL